MKFWIHLLFAFTGCLAVWAESPKVAILSDDPEGRTLVDLVLAQASERFAFVERQQIVKIEQESRLTPEFWREKTARNLKIAGADLFAVVDRNPVGQLQLTVFESTNGFRLRQRLLAAESDRAVTGIIANLNEAATMLDQPEQIRMISLVAVRNNLHYSLQKPALAEAQKIVGLVSAAPGVVILERDYLIELLKENQLSGKWQQIVTASEICHIELNPGSDVKHFTVALYLTDAAEQKTFYFESAEGDLQYFDKLSDAFAAMLKTPRGEPRFDCKTEAARFAREAALLDNDQSRVPMLKKYFAAAVLDADNPKYLLAVRDFHGSEVNATYPYLIICMEQVMAKPELLRNHEYADYISVNTSLIAKHRSELTPDNQLSFRQFTADHRDAFVNAALPPGPPWLQKINQFQNTLPQFYWEKSEFAAAGAATANDLLTAIKAEVPSVDLAGRAKLSEYILRTAPTFFEMQQAMAPSVRQAWTGQYAAALEELRQPPLSALAILLKVNALMSQRDYTDEQAAALLTEYFTICKQNRILGADTVLYTWPNLNCFGELRTQAREICQRIYR